jgi:membrane associated rhomboid family serine protease
VIQIPKLGLYLDPTTGSIAFQAAIGGIVATVAAIRIYWRRIRDAVAGGPKRQR